jgi:5-methylcytosine-specific restriction endonuclease McrA
MNLKPCGTKSAYSRHIYNKEKPCQPCKDANAAARREYYKKHAKQIYVQNRGWASRNPEKVREYSRRIAAKRKAQKMSNGHIPYTNQEVFDRYGTDCHICKTPIDFNAPRQASITNGWELSLHFDHLIPLSKGGPDTLENIRPSHAVCNMKKRNS